MTKLLALAALFATLTTTAAFAASWEDKISAGVNGATRFCEVSFEYSFGEIEVVCDGRAILKTETEMTYVQFNRAVALVLAKDLKLKNCAAIQSSGKVCFLGR